MKQAKNTICLWYDGDAEEAARFYAKTFPDSSVDAVHHAPGDFPSGKQGDVLTSGSRCRQARVRCDDADEQDRHRRDRSRTPGLRMQIGRAHV